METLGRFVIYSVIAVLLIVLAVILGDYGAWYFAWLLGTAMLVLVTVAGAALLDTQEAETQRRAD